MGCLQSGWLAARRFPSGTQNYHWHLLFLSSRSKQDKSTRTGKMLNKNLSVSVPCCNNSFYDFSFPSLWSLIVFTEFSCNFTLGASKSRSNNWFLDCKYNMVPSCCNTTAKLVHSSCSPCSSGTHNSSRCINNYNVVATKFDHFYTMYYYIRKVIHARQVSFVFFTSLFCYTFSHFL